MPTSNLHLTMHLDFTSERFSQAREQIIANGDDHATAANHLALIWTLNNDLEKQEWDCQIQQWQQAAAEHERQEEEEQERLQLERERANERLPSRRRGRNTGTSMHPSPKMPSSPLTPSSSPHPLPFANFTKGLHNVELSMHSTNDDALALLQMGDGLHSFILLAAAQAKGAVTADEDLSWEEFTEAAHCLATAMRENKWLEDRIDNHIKFWLAFEGHPWRHSNCEISLCATQVA
ncbi:hypothetical protein EDD17DRAFT_1508740 [Pisolithus thermaeus]|nr:hypothetical protein EDD17DRAFT_1508740 [Pisolithus thermaeus]